MNASSYSARVSRALNSLVLLGVTSILCFAFAWTFFNGSAACPFCELQRVAFVLAGVGLLLNVRLGPSPVHYAMTIGAAIGGMIVSGWQFMGHTATDVPRFRAVLLDWPLYTWALLAFALLVAYGVIMMAVDRKWGENAFKRQLSAPALLLMALFFLVSLAHVGNSVLEAGWGPCPQPDEYCESSTVVSGRPA